MRWAAFNSSFLEPTHPPTPTGPMANLFTNINLGKNTRAFQSSGRKDRGAHTGELRQKTLNLLRNFFRASARGGTSLALWLGESPAATWLAPFVAPMPQRFLN